MEKYKISFCTVAMNRLHHIKLTLRKNIENSLTYKTAEFVLLDYNSSDGLEDWVKANLQEFINSGLLKFYRTEDPQFFGRSHSRNMAFRLAEGQLICNVDADNFIGEGFPEFIARSFAESQNIFLTPYFYMRDVIGRLVIRKEDFLNARGYNETINGYGFEDIELYHRLSKLLNVRQQRFFEKEYLRVIHHPNKERIENEYLARNCKSIYISYIDPSHSELIYLFNDGKVEQGIVNDNSDMDKRDISNQFDSTISLSSPWHKGIWESENETIKLKVNGEEVIYTKLKQSHALYNRSKRSKLFLIVSEHFKEQMMLVKTEVENRMKLRASIQKHSYSVNPGGYGIGRVLLNFMISKNLE